MFPTRRCRLWHSFEADVDVVDDAVERKERDLLAAATARFFQGWMDVFEFGRGTMLWATDMSDGKILTRT